MCTEDDRQRLRAAMESAMVEAQQQLADSEAHECVRLAELALQGVHVVPWCPPGPTRPVCAACGAVRDWYQCMRTGRVLCGCQLVA